MDSSRLEEIVQQVKCLSMHAMDPGPILSATDGPEHHQQ